MIVLISEFMQDEIYLEEEIKYYTKEMGVLFFSTKGHIYDNKGLEESENLKIGEKNIFYRNILEKIYFFCKGVFNRTTFKELLMLIKHHKISLFSLKSLVLFSAKSQLLAKHIDNKLLNLNISSQEEILFYSYRFGIGVMAAIILKRKYPNSKIVARTHGQDLFEFRNNYEYLPYREVLYSQINEIFCISQDGVNYISHKYPQFLAKVKLFYLGTRSLEYNYNLSNQNLCLVTCSRISRIKRLHLLAKCLKEITDINIEWIHYGNGDEQYLSEIKDIIADFSSNIKVEFKGFVDNYQLGRDYQIKPYSVLVNVSESEGLPVSIMEACSVGMPVIATDVGGNKEIVRDNFNGYLLKNDFDIENLKNIILKINSLSYDEYKKLCLNSRQIWEQKFDCRKNYQKFIDNLTKV